MLVLRQIYASIVILYATVPMPLLTSLPLLAIIIITEYAFYNRIFK